MKSFVAIAAVCLVGCATQPPTVPPLPGPMTKRTASREAAAPIQPQTISATVRWNPSAGATGYKVYFGTAPQSLTLLATTSATNVTLAALPFACGFFHITATNQWGESR